MDQLLPIIRRVRRPLVAQDGRLELGDGRSGGQTAVPAVPVIPEREKTHDLKSESDHPAGESANRDAEVA
jgi:hypothetical protein